MADSEVAGWVSDSDVSVVTYCSKIGVSTCVVAVSGVCVGGEDDTEASVVSDCHVDYAGSVP